MPIREVDRHIGTSRNAVRRWVRTGAFVPYRRAPGPSQLDRHRAFVEVRWREGQRNGAALYRELRALGFTGGYDVLRRWAARRRQDTPARPPSGRVPSTRRVTRWLTSNPVALSCEDGRFAETLCAMAPKLGAAAAHAPPN